MVCILSEKQSVQAPELVNYPTPDPPPAPRAAGRGGVHYYVYEDPERDREFGADGCRRGGTVIYGFIPAGDWNSRQKVKIVILYGME